MALTLKINDVDQSSLVLWKSLKWSQALTSQVDTLGFQVQKFGTRTLSPEVLDEVTLYVDGTKVFGGNVVKVVESVASADRIIYNVTVKDYTHLLDRRLVVESYQSKPVINIICDILNRYVNKGLRIEIATFEASEVWNGGTVDTTNFIVGAQARKLTSTNAVMDSMYRDILVDLQPTGYTTSDYIELDVFVDDFTKLATATIKLGDATLANYFSANITNQITQSGHNLIRVLKSAFTTTGSITWPTIARIKCEVTSTASNTVNLTFDNWQEVSVNAFTRDNANSATQVVEFIAFNYEAPSKAIQRMAELFQWEWYVDELKGIHFFQKFDKLSPFNLTDTNGKYIFRSLQVNNNADQLRNSIFVRGGDYLAAQITDNVSHQADGINKIFKLGYKYANYSLSVDGVSTPVGVDNLDSYTSNNGANQINGGSFKNIGDVTGNSKQAEQVIVTKAGRRSGLSLKLKKVGSPVDNLQVQIFSDNGSNQPSGSNLSNVASIAGSLLSGTSTQISFSLVESASASLFFAVDQLYHIVVNRSGAVDPANYYQVEVTTGGTYEGVGNTYDGAAWSNSNANMYFLELIDYDVLYSFNEKILKFNSAPAGGTSIIFTAQPYKPIIVHVRENMSVNEFGEYEFEITDPSIQTQDGARQRARQEILGWAAKISECGFKTYQSGLRTGQTINIQSDIRGLNLDVMIQSISAVARTPDTLEYSVSCVTTKQMGILYFLQAELMKSNQQLVIDANEMSDKIEDFTTNFYFSTEYDSVQYVGHVWSADDGSTPNHLVWQGGDATMIWA